MAKGGGDKGKAKRMAGRGEVGGRWLWWSGGATGGECAGKQLRGADEAAVTVRAKGGGLRLSKRRVMSGCGVSGWWRQCKGGKSPARRGKYGGAIFGR